MRKQGRLEHKQMKRNRKLKIKASSMFFFGNSNMETPGERSNVSPLSSAAMSNQKEKKRNHEEKKIRYGKRDIRTDATEKVVTEYLEQSCALKAVEIYNLLRRNYEKKIQYLSRPNKMIKLGSKPNRNLPTENPKTDWLHLVRLPEILIVTDLKFFQKNQ